MKFILTTLLLLSALASANSVENGRDGLVPVFLAGIDSWETTLGVDYIYSSEPAGRVRMQSGILYQRLDPSDQGSTRDQAAVALPSGFRTYAVEQTIRLDPNWENVRGGKIGFGLGGGTNTSGGSVDPAGWTTRLMFRPDNQLVLYTYQTNRSFTNGGTWGDDNPIFQFDVGANFKVKMVVRLNTPGNSDGFMLVKVDDDLKWYKGNVQWQGEGTPGDKVRGSYNAFFGGNDPSWAPSRSQYYRVKNVEFTWW